MSKFPRGRHVAEMNCPLQYGSHIVTVISAVRSWRCTEVYLLHIKHLLTPLLY